MKMNANVSLQDLFKGSRRELKKRATPKLIKIVEFDDDDPESLHQVVRSVEKYFVLLAFDVHLEHQVALG